MRVLQEFCFVVALLVTVSSVSGNDNSLLFKETGKNRDLIGASDGEVVEFKCPPSPDGKLVVPCPTPDHHDNSSYTCIKNSDLCNRKQDCPNGEDELVSMCFYHEGKKAYLKQLVKQIGKFSG